MSQSSAPLAPRCRGLSSVADPPEAPALAEEVALLRTVIRRLADDVGGPQPMLRGMAELRHQIETLCTVLRTERALAGPPPDPFRVEFERALHELCGEDLASLPPGSALPA